MIKELLNSRFLKKICGGTNKVPSIPPTIKNGPIFSIEGSADGHGNWHYNATASVPVAPAVNVGASVFGNNHNPYGAAMVHFSVHGG